MKKFWYIMLLVAAILVTGCSTNDGSEKLSEDKQKEEVEVVFDAEMLATYNGKDGQPAYVAVDGIVYDVTDVKAWQSPHAGKFEPGKDYSVEIGSSPHGKNKLKGLTKVGTYEE